MEERKREGKRKKRNRDQMPLIPSSSSSLSLHHHLGVYYVFVLMLFFISSTMLSVVVVVVEGSVPAASAQTTFWINKEVNRTYGHNYYVLKPLNVTGTTQLNWAWKVFSADIIEPLSAVEIQFEISNVKGGNTFGIWSDFETMAWNLRTPFGNYRTDDPCVEQAPLTSQVSITTANFNRTQGIFEMRKIHLNTITGTSLNLPVSFSCGFLNNFTVANLTGSVVCDYYTFIHLPVSSSRTNITARAYTSDGSLVPAIQLIMASPDNKKCPTSKPGDGWLATSEVANNQLLLSVFSNYTRWWLRLKAPYNIATPLSPTRNFSLDILVSSFTGSVPATPTSSRTPSNRPSRSSTPGTTSYYATRPPSRSRTRTRSRVGPSRTGSRSRWPQPSSSSSSSRKSTPLPSVPSSPPPPPSEAPSLTPSLTTASSSSESTSPTPPTVTTGKNKPTKSKTPSDSGSDSGSGSSSSSSSSSSASGSSDSGSHKALYSILAIGVVAAIGATIGVWIWYKRRRLQVERV